MFSHCFRSLFYLWTPCSCSIRSLGVSSKRTLKRLNSLKPDVISYTALVSHMAGMADGVARWWMSVRLLQELRQQGLSPNRVSLNSLMATLPWLVALTSVLAIDGPGAANPAADVVSCNTAMDACAKAAQWGRAFELKEQMGLNALKTDVITSSALLTACEGAAVWPTGVRWLSASVVTFCGALSLLARRSVELWRGALQIFSAHKAELLRPNCYAYSAMASSLGAQGAWKGVFLLLASFKASLRLPLRRVRDPDAFRFRRSPDRGNGAAHGHDSA
ncbi:unnamed protein product [Durusdinium trenchii]|uniref:Uncharacterized protein n=1 Tax=Durusdinium trenchii TaxID=1381693 RepID=A0ABP0MZD6_9DINO